MADGMNTDHQRAELPFRSSGQLWLPVRPVGAYWELWPLGPFGRWNCCVLWHRHEYNVLCWLDSVPMSEATYRGWFL